MGKHLTVKSAKTLLVVNCVLAVTLFSLHAAAQNHPAKPLSPSPPVRTKPTKLLPPPPATTIRFINAPWDSVLVRARKQGKPIFVFFYSEGCDHCEREMATALTNKPLGDSINKYFLSAKIEAGSPEAKPLMENYNIHLYPSFILFDKKGLILHMEEGELPVSDLMKFIKKVNTPIECLFVLKRAYDAGNHDIFNCYNYALAACYHDKDASAKAFREYFNLQNEPITIQRNWVLITHLSYSADLPGFKMLLANREAFAKIYSDTLVNRYLYEGAINSIGAAADKRQSELFDATRGTFDNCKDTAYLSKYYAGAMYYFTKMQKRDSFILYADKGMRKYLWNDGIYLTSSAKRLLEFSNTAADYARCTEWLQRAMKIIPKDCRVYEASARVLIREGKRPEAIEMVKKGIEIGKENDCDLYPLYGLRTQLGIKE